MLPDYLKTKKEAENTTLPIIQSIYPNAKTCTIVDFYYDKLAGWLVAALLDNHITTIISIPTYGQPDAIIEETIEEFEDYEHYDFASPEEWTQSIFDTFLDNMEP